MTLFVDNVKKNIIGRGSVEEPPEYQKLVMK